MLITTERMLRPEQYRTMPKKTSQSYIPTVTACCIGYISEAVVNNFLPLLFLIFQSNLGISLERLALLGPSIL